MGRRPFDLASYSRYSAAEIACMGYGAMALMSVLRPEDFGQRPFRGNRQFLAAAALANKAVAALLHASPLSPGRRDWARRHRR